MSTPFMNYEEANLPPKTVLDLIVSTCSQNTPLGNLQVRSMLSILATNVKDIMENLQISPKKRESRLSSSNSSSFNKNNALDSTDNLLESINCKIKTLEEKVDRQNQRITRLNENMNYLSDRNSHTSLDNIWQKLQTKISFEVANVRTDCSKLITKVQQDMDHKVEESVFSQLQSEFYAKYEEITKSNGPIKVDKKHRKRMRNIGKYLKGSIMKKIEASGDTYQQLISENQQNKFERQQDKNVDFETEQINNQKQSQVQQAGYQQFRQDVQQLQITQPKVNLQNSSIFQINSNQIQKEQQEEEQSQIQKECLLQFSENTIENQNIQNLNSQQIFEEQINESKDLISTVSTQSMIWVDRACSSYSKLILTDNVIGAKKSANVFGTQNMKDHPCFILYVSRIQFGIDIGIIDSSLKNKSSLSHAHNWIYYSSDGACWDGETKVEGKGAGYQSLEKVTVFVDFKKKVVEWRVGEQIRYSCCCPQLAEDIEWVPYIYMQSKDDIVSIHESG